VLTLHCAADGQLVRVRLPGGRLTPVALDAVAGLAADLGNGIVELTSRASLQVRGLAPGDAEAAAARLRGAGLLPAPAHDRVRNILASPVAGRAPASLAPTDELVAALDRLLCADPDLAALPGRFLFAVDDRSATVASARCDVALVAEAAGVFRLALAGVRTTLVGGAALALDAARAFLAFADDAWRVAELHGGPARLVRRLGGELLGPLPAPAALEPGTLAQRDGRFAVTALPRLGRLDCATAARLAQLGELRLSSARTLTLVDLTPARAQRALAELAALGLVVEAGSGWSGLSACAGRGACERARVDVRAAAAQRAEARGPGAPAEHWAACERGCGRPAGAALTVLATSDGVAVQRGTETTATASVDEAVALLGAGA
jgi:sulfite reductase beta subunit-like hemoprotein